MVQCFYYKNVYLLEEVMYALMKSEIVQLHTLESDCDQIIAF